MELHKIIGISIIGGLWLFGVIAYIWALIRTRTWPCQLSDAELFERAFSPEPHKNSENEKEIDNESKI